MTKVDTRKRRQPEDSVGEPDRNHDSDTEMIDETIDVTFEFFDLNPIDYHALKHLVSQLFRVDSPADEDRTDRNQSLKPSKAPLKVVPEDIDLGELVDILLGEQKEWVGVTVKCDGEQNDPYGFVSVLDLKAYQDKASISSLTSYLFSCIDKSDSSQAPDLVQTLKQSLLPTGKGVGLLLSERLINMPVQVMPQLLAQVGNEIKHAQSKNASGFKFDKLLIPSRVFSIPNLSADDKAAADLNPTFDPNQKSRLNSKSDDKSCGPGSKKLKKDKDPVEPFGGNLMEDEYDLYHPEDLIISQFSSHTIHFDFFKPSNSAGTTTKQKPTSDLVNMKGFDQRGRLMLIDLNKWDLMIDCLNGFISSKC
ncbi:p21-C-terminal region-binding protein-domain-containing protein [Phakopsora pachyrhizi]|uniref:P21-C-terminal region-binding protein-domain-containing protein n=1 Tax=Phakopsora pachyrhizi TaxID=170000 RepID=A0AAV0BLB2_PHAPC|nr:p21-C-terminal region-binding protein-domain-containing protein [Phakopsora pachyrhizi]CAH7686939.1 p21-C-terminal region-binding protein-domain-containing protein [Phakopsora pachyrhizi]